MTEYLEYANILILIVGTFFVPRVRELLKDVSALKEGQVKLLGDIEKVDLKVEHIEGNYKQGLEHLSETVERMEKNHEAGIERLEGTFSKFQDEMRELFQRRRQDD